jgi:hypothetical protein
MPNEVRFAARLFIGGLFAVLFLIWLTASAFAQAAKYWNDPRIQQCCSEADAVYADDWRVLPDGSVIAVVTGGGPRNHAWAPIGKEYHVPAGQVVDVPGNPTGRPLLFLAPHSLSLYCFALGPLI